jgi:hypothetical protein
MLRNPARGHVGDGMKRAIRTAHQEAAIHPDGFTTRRKAMNRG